MILLESRIIRTTWFDMKLKYRKTMMSCEKALWFLFVQIKLILSRGLQAVSYLAENKCRTIVTDKIMCYCLHTEKTIIITLKFMQTKVEVTS